MKSNYTQDKKVGDLSEVKFPLSLPSPPPAPSSKCRAIWLVIILLLNIVFMIVDQFLKEEMMAWSIRTSEAMQKENRGFWGPYFDIFTKGVYFGIVGVVFVLLFVDPDKPRAVKVVLFISLETFLSNMIKIGIRF